jgi:PilZ domain
VGHSIERRSSRRFQIVLPVLFRWADTEKHHEAGQSENISKDGISVLTKNCPPLGAKVEVEFSLPISDLIRQTIRIRYVGHVCRVESSFQPKSFALAGQWWMT